MLICKEHARTVRGVGRFDPAVACVLVQLGLESVVLLGIYPLNAVTRSNSVGDQVHPVVRCAGGWEALWKVLGEDVLEARKKLLKGSESWYRERSRLRNSKSGKKSRTPVAKPRFSLA